MPLKYIPKIFLIFKLPDGTSKEGFFRQSQLLKDIIASFGVEGEAFLIEPQRGIIHRAKKTKLDKDKNIGQLGLKNDDIIEIK